MSIFGEIADSILIGGACITADIECALSSIGINKRAREVGKKNKKDKKSSTDRAPSNPQQITSVTTENISTDHLGTDVIEETPRTDETVLNNDGGSDLPKKNKKDKHKKNKKPQNPPVEEPNPELVDETTNEEVSTNEVVVAESADADTGDAPINNQTEVRVEGGVDATMNNRPFMSVTDNGRIAVDLGAVATGGATNNAFRTEGQAVNNFHPMPHFTMYREGPLPFVTPNQPVGPAPIQVIGRGMNPNMVVNNTNPAPSQNMPHGMTHKVDEPKKPKPMKMPRNPDKTKIDDPTKQVMNDMVQIQPVEPNVTIDKTGFIPDVPNPDTTPEKPTSKFRNNQFIIENYPFIGEIEEIALNNGYQIEFKYFDNLNIIAAGIYDGNTMTLINDKGFIIDLGSIIDRRKKVFLGLPTIFERLPAYHMFLKPDKSGKSKLNKEFFKTIIVGGNAAAANIKPMYSEDFVNLNAHVALITMTSFNLHPDDRRYIQTRLVDALNAGIFGEVRHVDELARFRIADFDKKTKTIVLDSAGIPLHYGHPFVLHPRHQILITEKNMTIKHGDFIEVPQ